jgi:hypothetical protein
VAQLDNYIVVWERPDQPKLPSILPRKTIPLYQRLMWGILPLTCLCLGILFQILLRHPSWPQAGALLAPAESGRFFLGGIRGNLWLLNLIWMMTLTLVVALTLCLQWRKNAPHASKENILQAYYQALDHKEMRRSYDFFDPQNRPDLTQYLLERSVEGGILASYAKLDSIAVKYQATAIPDSWRVDVKAHWLTALFEYTVEDEFVLRRDGLSWYLSYPEKKLSKTFIPPEQFHRLSVVEYHSQGRRKTTEKKTSKRDILDRPDVYIHSAALVERKGRYFVVGELVNVDNDPAYLTVEAVLYDSLNQELTRYNARDLLMHDLLPKENTPFRVDFENWDRQENAAKPFRFVLFVRSMVSEERMYKHTGVQHLRAQDGELRGELVNYGTRQIMIPELILSQYDEQDRVWWVEADYLPFSLRPQRKSPFATPLISPLEVCVLQQGDDDNLLINGVSRREYRDELNSTWLLKALNPASLTLKLDSIPFSVRLAVNPLPVSTYEPR